MTEDARHRVEQALMQMARLAAPTLPPADNAIIAELKRKYDFLTFGAAAEGEDDTAGWTKAVAA